MGKSATTFAASWRLGPTDVIRVPKAMKERLLEIARHWDTTGIEPVTMYTIAEPAPIYQLSLPAVPAPAALKPVNVSSIPQLSPFRYPGGKTWLIPSIRKWLFHSKPNRLFEPFAGGGIVSLTAATENFVDEVFFCELDNGVAAVWTTVLSSNWTWLADKILAFKITEASVRCELARTPDSTKHLAFQTILRNRVQRGGIMAAGAGLVKSGENGKGLLSRWYPETLANRLAAIHAQRNRLTFLPGDAFAYWSKYARDPKAATYIDPPYVQAAKRLYNHWQVPHEDIFSLAARTKGVCLLSYDNTPEVTHWARGAGLHVKAIAMKNSHHATMDELLISRDLHWLDADSLPIAA